MQHFALAALLSALLVPVSASAQRSMDDYTSAQRVVVERYLADNPSLYFIPESQFDQRTLREKRQYFPDFIPYYVWEDFTGDGRKDLAVLLGDRQDRSRTRMAVFNQVDGLTYSLAFEHGGVSPRYSSITANGVNDICYSDDASSFCFPYENGEYGFFDNM